MLWMVLDCYYIFLSSSFVGIPLPFELLLKCEGDLTMLINVALDLSAAGIKF